MKGIGNGDGKSLSSSSSPASSRFRTDKEEDKEEDKLFKALVENSILEVDDGGLLEGMEQGVGSGDLSLDSAEGPMRIRKKMLRASFRLERGKTNQKKVQMEEGEEEDTAATAAALSAAMAGTIGLPSATPALSATPRGEGATSAILSTSNRPGAAAIAPPLSPSIPVALSPKSSSKGAPASTATTHSSPSKKLVTIAVEEEQETEGQELIHSATVSPRPFGEELSGKVAFDSSNQQQVEPREEENDDEEGDEEEEEDEDDEEEEVRFYVFHVL